MIRACVTVSLVEEARGGPFLFWDGVADACRHAEELGFDAIEIFPPGPEAIDRKSLSALLETHHLRLAAVGTGAGWLKHRLSLTAAEADQRGQARAFVRSIIDAAAPLGASAIIGSMQGRHGEGVSRDQAIDWLRSALEELGAHARSQGVPLIYETLNRYETNICNTIGQGVALLRSLQTDNVTLLADLFHMNIEEADLGSAIRRAGSHIGHLHFVDSNRRPAGCGHLDYAPIAAALREIGYSGYASAEAFPYPDSCQAARQTMETFRHYLAVEPPA
jgi:sugar phosphate isomerase/epimerase